MTSSQNEPHAVTERGVIARDPMLSGAPPPKQATFVPSSEAVEVAGRTTGRRPSFRLKVPFCRY